MKNERDDRDRSFVINLIRKIWSDYIEKGKILKLFGIDLDQQGSIA